MLKKRAAFASYAAAIRSVESNPYPNPGEMKSQAAEWELRRHAKLPGI
jgi:hypothetical protein